MRNRIIMLSSLLLLLLATIILIYMHPVPPDRQNDSSQLRQLALWQQEMQDHFKKGDYYAAGRKARQILFSFPADPDALYMQSRLCCREGNYREALSIYSRILAEKPHDIISRNNCALITLLMQGDPDAAYAQLQKALITAPEQPVITYNLQIINRFRGLPDSKTPTDKLPVLPDVKSHPNMLYILPGKLAMYEAEPQTEKEM